MQNVFRVVLLCVFLVCGSLASYAEEQSSNGHDLNYNFVYNPLEDPDALAQDVRYFNRVANQGFRTYIYDNMDSGRFPAAVLWSIYTTYIGSVVMTHELGHRVRVKSFGGEQNIFSIKEMLIPGFIASEAAIPDVTFEKRYLASLGGFEANSLYALQQEAVFHRGGQAYTPELAPYLLNKLFFPMYGYVIKPGTGSDRDTLMKDQAGDVANLALLAYQRQGGSEVILGADGYPILATNTVPDGLVNIYDEMKQKSLYAFLDPMVLWSLYRFTSEEEYLDLPEWNITDNFSWMYGIHFSPSLFGYDLYFTQYMSLYDYDFSIYIRDGGSLKSKGYGFSVENLYENGGTRVGFSYDSWDQDTYGKGNAYAITGRYFISENWGVSLKLGQKDAGYMIGKNIDADTFGYIGIAIK